MRGLTAVVAAGLALAVPATAHAAAPAVAPYVVTLDASVDDSGTAVESLEGTGGFQAGFRYHTALKGFSADLDARQVARLERDSRVAFVEPDIAFTAAGRRAEDEKEPEASEGPAKGRSAEGTRAAQVVPAGIRRIGAATATTTHGSSITNVAVLDTGVDLRSPDLDAISGVNCIRPGTPAQDDDGHGTNVAGVIAARDDDGGALGVAPATRIYAVKVMRAGGTGTLSQILCGIDWVTAHAQHLNISVANLSAGAAGTDDGHCGATSGDAQHAAICRSVAAGVTYVAAAGNRGADFATTVPAAYSEVLSVTAMTDTDGEAGGTGAAACLAGEQDDRYAAYSNFAVGADAASHTLAAPGTCVVSTGLGGGTATYYGTSQAAPHVAGTVALCLGSAGRPGPCGGLTPAEVIRRVRGDAQARATLANGFAGDTLRPSADAVFGPLAAADAY